MVQDVASKIIQHKYFQLNVNNIWTNETHLIYRLRLYYNIQYKVKVLCNAKSSDTKNNTKKIMPNDSVTSNSLGNKHKCYWYPLESPSWVNSNKISTTLAVWMNLETYHSFYRWSVSIYNAYFSFMANSLGITCAVMNRVYDPKQITPHKRHHLRLPVPPRIPKDTS